MPNAGNATLDTNGNNVSFANAIGAGTSSSLTKAGAGTLTLTNTNTYTGGTILNQGTLSLSTNGTLGATTGALSVNNTNTGAGTAAVLNLATAVDTTVGSLSGTIATPSSGTNSATINLQTGRVFNINQTVDGTYAGVLGGTGREAGGPGRAGGGYPGVGGGIIPIHGGVGQPGGTVDRPVQGATQACGPGSPDVKSQMILSCEQHVDWIVDCLRHLHAHGLAAIEPTDAAQDAWTQHVLDVASATLYPLANSWYMGANIPGKPRVFMPYAGGMAHYRRICADVAEKGYAGFELR